MMDMSFLEPFRGLSMDRRNGALMIVRVLQKKILPASSTYNVFCEGSEASLEWLALGSYNIQVLPLR